MHEYKVILCPDEPHPCVLKSGLLSEVIASHYFKPGFPSEITESHLFKRGLPPEMTVSHLFKHGLPPEMTVSHLLKACFEKHFELLLKLHSKTRAIIE